MSTTQTIKATEILPTDQVAMWAPADKAYRFFAITNLTVDEIGAEFTIEGVARCTGRRVFDPSAPQGHRQVDVDATHRDLFSNAEVLIKAR